MSLWLLKLKLNTFYQIKVCTSLVQLLDRHHRLPDSVWWEVVWVWPDVSRSFYKGRCMYTLCTHNRIHLHHLILRPAPQRLVLAVDRGCSPSKPTDQHPSHHLISWLVGCFGSLIFILVKLFCGTATFLSSMSAWTDREVSGYLDIHQLLQKCTSSWMKIFYSWKSNYDSVIIPDLELYNADLAYLLKKYDAYLTKAPGLLDFVLALAQLWPLTWGDFLWYEWLPFALKSINPIRAKKKIPQTLLQREGWMIQIGAAYASFDDVMYMSWSDYSRQFRLRPCMLGLLLIDSTNFSRTQCH